MGEGGRTWQRDLHQAQHLHKAPTKTAIVKICTEISQACQEDIIPIRVNKKLLQEAAQIIRALQEANQAAATHSPLQPTDTERIISEIKTEIKSLGRTIHQSKKHS